ncbi:hypothetical protein TNCV_139121 [Trichonephila clavipes]|nr:hypothetical protein TNCV_139121 [Trichonephila clavipes]
MRSSSNEDPCVERLTHIKSVNAQNLPLSSSGSSEWDLPAYVGLAVNKRGLIDQRFSNRINESTRIDPPHM